jgi:hypothetical protein
MLPLLTKPEKVATCDLEGKQMNNCIGAISERNYGKCKDAVTWRLR